MGVVVLNKLHVKQRFSQALPSYDRQAKVQQQINRRLIQLLQQNHRLEFEHLLEIGCGTGGLTQLLQQHCRIARWSLNDLCDSQDFLQPLFAQQTMQFYCGDAEELIFPHQYDLIASASTVQWFQQPQQFIQRSADSLKPKGLLLFSTFSPQNLAEIRQLTGIGLHYPSLAQWQQWLTAKFKLLSAEQHCFELYFDSPLAVLRHLRQTGVNAIQPRVWHKSQLELFCKNYKKIARSCNDNVRLTYTPMLFLAQKED